MFKFPLNVEIDLTNKCNYNCLYCRNGKIIDKSELDIFTIKKIVEELKENNIFSVNLSGGEPLLHSHFVEIIELFYDNGITWNLTSNGSLIDEKMAILLKKNNINSLFITLTGMSDDLDSFHKKGVNTFSKIMQCVNLCNKININLILGFLLTSRNTNDIEKFAYFVKENHIKAKIMKIKPLGNSLLNQNLYIDDKEYLNIINDIKDILGENLIIGEQNEDIADINCMAGITSCVIGADGYVYPCVMFLGYPSVRCGSIKEQSLFNIWNNSNILKEFRKSRQFENKCNRCSKRSRCNGGCRGKAFIQKGNYIKVECGGSDDL